MTVPYDSYLLVWGTVQALTWRSRVSIAFRTFFLHELCFAWDPSERQMKLLKHSKDLQDFWNSRVSHRPQANSTGVRRCRSELSSMNPRPLDPRLASVMSFQVEVTSWLSQSRERITEICLCDEPASLESPVQRSCQWCNSEVRIERCRRFLSLHFDNGRGWCPWLRLTTDLTTMELWLLNWRLHSNLRFLRERNSLLYLSCGAHSRLSVGLTKMHPACFLSFSNETGFPGYLHTGQSVLHSLLSLYAKHFGLSKSKLEVMNLHLEGDRSSWSSVSATANRLRPT